MVVEGLTFTGLQDSGPGADSDGEHGWRGLGNRAHAVLWIEASVNNEATVRSSQLNYDGR